MELLRVKLWTYCYRCRRLYGNNPPPAQVRIMMHRDPGVVSAGLGWNRGHEPMWLWDYAFTVHGRAMYTRAQFRRWERAVHSVYRMYPKVRADLFDATDLVDGRKYPIEIHESL